MVIAVDREKVRSNETHFEHPTTHTDDKLSLSVDQRRQFSVPVLEPLPVLLLDETRVKHTVGARSKLDHH